MSLVSICPLDREVYGPVNDFVGRLKYYQDNKSKLQSYIDEKEVGDGYGLWGTSYWPDGVIIISMLRNQGDHEKLKKIEKLISVNEYFLNYQKPEILLPSIIGLTQFFWLSNYNLSYLIPRDVGLENIRNFIKLHMSKVYLIQCILIIFFLRTLGIPVFFYMLSAPMFVFVGDGYYEFEKHLVVFFIGLPLFFGIFLYSKFFQIGSGR